MSSDTYEPILPTEKDAEKKCLSDHGTSESGRSSWANEIKMLKDRFLNDIERL